MKKIFKTFIFLGLLASVTSCKKYLDVNTDPNNVTSATPDLILPQALAATAGLTSNTFSLTYGGDLGGYIANAGGVSGYGNFWTFTFNSGDFNGLWSSTFDNLQDYQYILNNSTTTGDYKFYNAVARLMKSYDYLKLVDAYGDVPYTQALQGAAVLTPAYDTGQAVYKACLADIDLAITTFKSGAAASNVSLAPNASGAIDVTVYSPTNATSTSNKPMSYNSAALLNGYDMTKWIQFANTIKLRALIRIQKADAATFASYKAAMAALLPTDFISGDVLINPGYLQQSGKQNPLWNGFGWTYVGNGSTTSYLPTKFAVAFYDGTKLSDGVQSRTSAGVVTYKDAGRGNLIYRDYFFKNQLGFQSTDATLLPIAPTGGPWYPGQSGNGSPTKLAATGYGIMKGFDQGSVMISAAESYFLQAEGSLIGLTNTGSALTLFESGITASYAYLDKDHTDALVSSIPYIPAPAVVTPATQLAAYKAANATSYLVNFNLAGTAAQQLEAIITQKYIALNMLNCDEGWNEYRRTLYPVSVPPSATANAASPTLSFAPNAVSITTPRSDGLAGRIIYPSSETSYNTANVPAVNTSSSLVFWDARPKN